MGVGPGGGAATAAPARNSVSEPQAPTVLPAFGAFMMQRERRKSLALAGLPSDEAIAHFQDHGHRASHILSRRLDISVTVV
jgi:hypothetical protein